jgi:hypothetical protein
VNLILDEVTAAAPETDSVCSPESTGGPENGYSLENYLALPDHTLGSLPEG